MSNKLFSTAGRITTSTLLGLIALFIAVVISVSLHLGCKNEASSVTSPGDQPSYLFESTGEEFLISALDEIESIADLAKRTGSVPRSSLDLNKLSASLPSKDRKQIISSTESDTSYIYGEVTKDGYGAVVTERHTYPKGILLIIVRKSYGKPPTKTVTETKRYITYQDFLSDSNQQSNITEVFGLSNDTIVTHVLRNGTVETYTFRLPVVTRTTNPSDGSVRVTTRYGAAGAVRSEVRDGSGNLVQIRITQGETDGALTTYTEYSDGSWRNVRSIGRADGSVYHEITSGP